MNAQPMARDLLALMAEWASVPRSQWPAKVEREVRRLRAEWIARAEGAK